MLEFIIGLPIGGIITWIIRELVSDKLARDRALEIYRITEFNKAAAEFQCSFIEVKQKLRDDLKADWNSILNSNVLIEHEKAAIRFKLFLTDDERTRFDLDWNTYFSHRPHPGDRHAPEKTPEEWSDEDNCKIFLEQINVLLTYAKLK